MSIVVILLVGIAVLVIGYLTKGEFYIKSAFLASIAMAVVVAMFLGFTVVQAGTVGIVTRWGKVNRTLMPGAHLIIPFAETSETVSTQTLVVKPSETASSKDLQEVHMETTLAYHFDPAYAGWLYAQVIDNGPNAVENKVIVPALLEAMKACSSRYDAQQLIQRRAQVRDDIESFVQTRLLPYHIVPETVSITNFNFSKDYNDAIEAKVTAAQRAEKAQNDLTRIKVEAEQKVAAAQGEAEALKVQKEQITPELLKLRTIEMLQSRWDGHLPVNYYGGSAPLPMMDVLAAGRQTTK